MKLILSIAMALILSSCQEFLDQVPQEILTEDKVFANKDNMAKVLTQAYSQVRVPVDFTGITGAIGGGIGLMGGEATYNWSNYSPYQFEANNYSQANQIFNIWAISYASIKICHYFLANIDKCQDEKLSEQERIWWKGEAKFLLAYYYFLLLQQYGPVPIVDPKTYYGAELEQSIKDGVPRPTFDEMVTYIDNLLTDADSQLDLSFYQTNIDRLGRASKTIVRFLRARLLMYAASPLYNGLLNPSTGVSFPQLMIKDNTGKNLLSASPDAAKWTKALEACKEALSAAKEAGFRLVTFIKNDPNVDSKYKAYKRVFNTSRAGSPNYETLFYVQAISAGFINTSALPLSFQSYSGISPTQQHADEYFTSKGLMTKDDSEWRTRTAFFSYKTSKDNRQIYIHPKFQKRDPRFYANILFPGQHSYYMDGSSVTSENKDKDRKWSWALSSGGNTGRLFDPWYDGADGFGKKSGRDYCINGYLLYKWVAHTFTTTTRGDWLIPIFRYGELLLNTAECAFEKSAAAGGGDLLSNPDIWDNWNELRARVGLPDVRSAYRAAGIPLDAKKIRELIHTERRVELAFEGLRYFDNRRWLEAREKEEGTRLGFSILSPGGGPTSSFWNQTSYQNLVFYDRKYFMPIPQDELNKNPALSQNPGW